MRFLLCLALALNTGLAPASEGNSDSLRPSISTEKAEPFAYSAYQIRYYDRYRFDWYQAEFPTTSLEKVERIFRATEDAVKNFWKLHKPAKIAKNKEYRAATAAIYYRFRMAFQLAANGFSEEYQYEIRKILKRALDLENLLYKNGVSSGQRQEHLSRLMHHAFEFTWRDMDNEMEGPVKRAAVGEVFLHMVDTFQTDEYKQVLEDYKKQENRWANDKRSDWRFLNWMLGLGSAAMGAMATMIINMNIPYYSDHLDGRYMALLGAVCAVTGVESVLRYRFRKNITCRTNPLHMTIKKNCSDILDGEKLRGRE